MFDFNFDPKKIDPKILISVLLGTGLVGKFFYDNYFDLDFITYTDFVKTYLEGNQIKNIVINRMNDGSHYKTYAVIHTHGGETKHLILGNVDHFLENLERH